MGPDLFPNAIFYYLHCSQHGFTTRRRGEKAFAPVATPGRMMPRANAPLAPQQARRIPQPAHRGLGLGFRIALFLGEESPDVPRRCQEQKHVGVGLICLSMFININLISFTCAQKYISVGSD